MRAIMVAVDYTDLLSVTLPYNFHHFEEVWVITDGASHPSVVEVAKNCPGRCDQSITILATELFYASGAKFNKWAALEWGLDQMGRHGWLTILDADVLWPKNAIDGAFWRIAHKGFLYTPYRRMWDNWPHNPLPIRYTDSMLGVSGAEFRMPSEEHWGEFPLHRQQREFAGYTQIFHADDPHLGPAPWHQTDWRHAGGADSFFQAKWPESCKVRPPFEVLHLGPAGQNWYGRATPRLDGSMPSEAQERLQAVAKIWTGRRGKAGDERFRDERLPPTA